MAFFDRNLFNVIWLGFSFFLIFTAFQTTSILEVTALKHFFSNSSSPNSGSTLELNLGYYSLCIIYGMLAISNWVAPSILSVLGYRITLFVSALIYTIFIATLIHPTVWSVLIASVLLGAVAGPLWTAQGAYLNDNSTPETSARNSSVFWALLQLSFFVGNLFLFLYLFFSKPSTDSSYELTSKEITIIFSVLTGFGLCGAISMLFLLPPEKPIYEGEEQALIKEKSTPSSILINMLYAFKSSIMLSIKKEMIFLSIVFIYTGLELNFFTAVYGTCIGNVQLPTFGIRAVGLNGIFIGLGEVTGGLIFMVLGALVKTNCRKIIVIVGFLVHMTTFFIIYLNMPKLCPFTNNDSSSDLTQGAFNIDSIIYIAMLCSFALGFADSCFNTQIYSYISSEFKNELGAPSMALYKFFQSIAAMAAFFYNPYLHLYYQLAILVVFCTLATISYLITESLTKTRNIFPLKISDHPDKTD